MTRSAGPGVPAMTIDRLGRLSTGAIVGAIALVIGAAVAQVSVLTRLPLPGATPDLALLVMVGLALARGPMVGAIAGFGTGLLLDVIPPADHAIGRYALVLCLLGYLLGTVGHRLVEGTLGLMVVAAASSAAAFLGFAVVGALTGDLRVRWPLVADLLPSAVLYDAAIAALLVRGVLALYRPATRGELGTTISVRKARRLNPLARRQERAL